MLMPYSEFTFQELRDKLSLHLVQDTSLFATLYDEYLIDHAGKILAIILQALTLDKHVAHE
jgi:hypothetical protein